MAKQYVLTTTPVKLDETKGIIYNKSRDTIELYSTDTAEIGTGLPVLSGQRQAFSGTVYARAIDGEGTEAIINVVDFNVSAGGGEDTKISYDKIEGLDDHVKTIKVNNATTADKATGNAGTATKLATARTIALSGAATGTATSFNGSANISIPVTALDATKLTGIAPKATSDKNGADITSYIKTLSFAFPIMTSKTGANAAATYIFVPDGAPAHNSAPPRGKDLTSYFTSGNMSKAIADGTFRDIFIGDYITVTMTVDGTSIGTVKWIVAGCDYLYLSGDSHCTTHHVIMVPQDVLNVNTRMCASNDTTGGYIASEMWTTTLPKYTAAIQSAFGTAHVVKHRELLSNAISSTAASAAGAGWVGSSTGWGWYDVYANLMNEPMVYGGTVFSSSGFDVGNCKTQLPLFQHDHSATIAGYRNNRTDYKWYWLRAVGSSAGFCYASHYGSASCDGAAFSDAWGGVRPYFLLA